MIMATKTAGEKNAKTQVCAFFNATTHQTLPPKKGANEARIQKRRKHMVPSFKNKTNKNLPHFCIFDLRTNFLAGSIKKTNYTERPEFTYSRSLCT